MVVDEGENLNEFACWEVGEARGLTVGVGMVTSGGRVEVEVEAEADGMAATLGTLAVEAIPLC